jgi:hypothetical protein
MENVSLKLKVSTLRAIVSLSCAAGESLRTTFEHDCLNPHERRAVFARWNQVRQQNYRATVSLESLLRSEMAPEIC